MNYNCISDIVKDLEQHPVETNGNVYHPIPFDEFSHLKTSSNQSESEKKWRLIQSTIQKVSSKGMSGLRVLDVGANAGFFSYSLASAGAHVTAFEPHPRYSVIGPTIIEAKGLPITWHGLAFDASKVKGQHFDVALMLSVFQWMSQGDDRIEQASRQLGKISQMTRYLFFELGYNHGKSCITTTRRNHYGALVDFLRANTEFTSFRMLGKTKLWKHCKRYLVLCSNDPHQDDRAFRRTWRGITV